MIVVTYLIIAVGVIASIIGAALYIPAQTLHKEILIAIGYINIVISLAMIFIVFILLKLVHSTTPIVNFNSFLVLGGLGFIFLFILAQTIYLLDRKSPIRRQIERLQHRDPEEIQAPLIQIPQNKTFVPSEEVSITASQPSTFEKAYREGIAEDSYFTALQILKMSYPLSTSKIYIPIKLHEEPPPSPKDNASKSKNLSGDLSDNMKEPEENGEGLEKYRINDSDAINLVLRNQHCILLGDPGVGKTTFLKYLVVKAAQKEFGLEKLPIYVDLNYFASKSSKNSSDLLLAFIVGWIRTRYTPNLTYTDTETAIQDFLKDGDVLLLLDALDETFIGENKKSAHNHYIGIMNTIKSFAHKYKRISIVVTSRRASYELHSPLSVEGKDFPPFYITGFREEDKQRFIINWFEQSSFISESASSENLIFTLTQSSRLRALASNPLMLALIVNVFMRKLPLSKRRAELYDKCIKTLIDNWDLSRGIERSSSFTEETKLQLLEYIGWQFQKERKDRCDEKYLLQEITNFLAGQGMHLKDPSTILREIEGAHGLLKKDESENKQYMYSFPHLAFQEYFAAKYSFKENLLSKLLSYRFDPRWEEVIILYTDIVYQADILQRSNGHITFLQELQKDDDIFSTQLALRGRCMVAIFDPLEERSRTISSRLTETIAYTEYSRARVRLIEALTEIGGDTNEQWLLDRLLNHQDDGWLCREIVNAIIHRGEHSLLYKLVEILVDMNDESKHLTKNGLKIENSTRKLLVDALRQTDEKKITQKLVDMLINTLPYMLTQTLPVSKQYQQLETQRTGIEALFESILDTLSGIGDHSIAPDLLPLLDKTKLAVNAPGLLPLHLDMTKLSFKLKRKIVQVIGVLGANNPDVLAKMLILLEDTTLPVNERLKMHQTIIETLPRFANEKTMEKSKQIIVEKLRTFLKDKPSESEWTLQGRALIVLSVLGEYIEDPQQQQILQMITGLHKEKQEQENLIRLIGDLKAFSLIHALFNLLLNDSNDSIEPDIQSAIARLSKDHKSSNTLNDLDEFLSQRKAGPHADASDADIVRVFKYFREDPSIVSQKLITFLTVDKFRNRLYLLLGSAEVLGAIDTSEEMSLFVRDQLEHLLQSPFDALRISMCITFYSLGDTSVLNELVEIFCSQKISHLRVTEDEKTAMSSYLKDVLQRTTKDQDLVQALCKRLTGRKLEPEVRRNIVNIIGERAEDIQTCKTLIRYVEDRTIKENIYEALWKISRREGFRIFKNGDGQIQVEAPEERDLILNK